MTMDHLQYAKQLSEPPADRQYGVAVPYSESKGRTPIYRHAQCADGPLARLDPNVRTIHEIFETSANRYPRNRCLGWREYEPAKKAWASSYRWLDYGTVQRRRANLGVGIVEVMSREGVARGSKYGVGLWSKNRPEWQMTDLACLSQSLFTVSLYDTLGPSATEYIINHAELVCVATTLPHIPTLIKLKPRLASLKVIISLDTLDSSSGDETDFSKRAILDALAAGVKIYSMEQVEAIGAKVSNGQPQYNPPGPDDIITINYTSGTTGMPKGVLHTHATAVAAAGGSLVAAPGNSGDKIFSFLPLAHIFARVSEHGVMWNAGGIGYFHGDILALVDDAKVLKPDLQIVVPRLINRFGGAVKAATIEQPGLKGSLARHIVSTKTAAMLPPDTPTATNRHAFYDRIWGHKVASALGMQNLKSMVSGAAPLDPALHRFFRTVLGPTNFMQGYGLTETYAHGFVQNKADMSVGNCGPPPICIEACLQDVPDMEYLTTDTPQPRGEILLRGPTVFKGYFRDPAETAKAMLPDGWFRTGDVGTVDSHGRFTVIDRVKNVLKLAQGEYVSPERLENIYLSNLTYLAMGFVHGDSVKTHLVGIFGVQPDFFAPWASKITKHHIDPTDLDTIKSACEDPAVVRAAQADLDRVGQQQKFAGFERVRSIRLMLDPFTVDNELLTPTLKLKRPVAAKKFRAVIDEMYGQVDRARL